MKKITLIIVLIFLLVLPLVSAATLECFDDGSIKIDGLKKRWPISAKEKYGGKDYFEVPGEYIEKTVKGKEKEKEKIYSFYSDEALFVSQEGAKYTVKFGKYSSTVTCPPFRFSCRIFNLSIDYCYNRNNTFTSKFMVYNFYFNKTSVLRFTQPYLLWYEVKTESKRNLVHAADRYSPEFREINITLRKLNAGSKFILRWPTKEKVEKFFIMYHDCRQKRYNLYKSAQCTEAMACTIDKDCLADEYCEKGVCEKLDCGECQYIDEHQCFNYTCCLNEDCALEEQCLNHSCVRFQCAEEEFVSEHACQKLECAFDESVFNHTCVKLECLDEEEAVNHICMALSCGRFEKPFQHKCLSYFKYYYHKLIKNNQTEEK
ncbi:MAG: hypothetical protein AB1668_00805 [Nanoarchaeota archaeon]